MSFLSNFLGLVHLFFDGLLLHNAASLSVGAQAVGLLLSFT